MILKRFTDFRSTHLGQQLNENVQQAKTYIRNLALKAKKEKTPAKEGETVGLTSEELRKADNNPSFQKVLAIVKDSQALAYVFTKMYYEDLSQLDEEERLTELRGLLEKLKRHRTSLNNLPMPVERYVSRAAIEEEERNSSSEDRQYRTPFERLGDDLTRLEGSIAMNKWIGDLLSFQKAWMEKLTPYHKEKIEGIAKAFDDFGIEDGVKDKETNKSLQKIFFQGVLQYKTLETLIKGAEDYIKAANNAGMKKFLVAMDKVNKKFGFNNGAEQVFTKDSILIIEVKSYPANVDLNANTAHCITKSTGHWETYVGLEKYTKQYYIYDFDLPPSDIHSVIGITIGEGGKITACHLKNDRAFGSEIVSYMKKKGIDMKVMSPLSKEEIEQRKRKIIASKEIVKDNLNLEQVKKYFEDGADVNAGNGRPLENAVKEDNYEKAEYLLSLGAIPGINNPIKYAKNLEMVKLLVRYNCPLTNEVFNSIVNDSDAIKFVLSKGVDPNFEKGYPLRAAVRANNLESVKILIKGGASVSERRYMVVKQCVESGSVDILEYLLTELIKSDSSFKNTEFRTKLVNEWKNWNTSSLQTKADLKEEIMTVLSKYE